MTILHLSLALVADPINVIIPSVIVFLSWAAGMYWFGPSDETKRIKGIKHDGRRFAYRGAMVAAVCGLIWWATSWPLASAILTLLASGFSMSIGVRVGFNLAAGVDWRYLGNTSIDDVMFMLLFMPGPIPARIENINDHADYHRKPREDAGYFAKDMHAATQALVHRCGYRRTLVEALAALILVAAQLWF